MKVENRLVNPTRHHCPKQIEDEWQQNVQEKPNLVKDKACGPRGLDRAQVFPLSSENASMPKRPMVPINKRIERI
jgi:hypothetical protein